MKTILGHEINKLILILLKNLRSYSDKQILIHPYEILEEESGIPADPTNMAVSISRYTNYNCIWIKTKVDTKEFNAILAEEIMHLIQIFERYPTITTYKFLTKKRSKQEFYEKMREDITKIVFDIDAHYRLYNIGFDILPLIRSDYSQAKKSIENIDSDTIQLLSNPFTHAGPFIQYLLWWYDLSEIPSEFNSLWEDQIYPWYKSHINPNTFSLWEDVIEKINKSGLGNAECIQKVLQIIWKNILFCEPSFGVWATSGSSLKTIKIRELIPE